ncbi:MAG: G/U mismatch-specific DNA glycosylase [Gemmataceae bacterium]|nr:G/U mismatch-specific DNA glycosylase [Gemmataceae bacterium]
MGTPPKGYWKPTAADLDKAKDQGLADLLQRGLKVLFCGINPGLYTAAIGKHFGRPGNRFWPALHAGGFTPRLFSPFEQRWLLPLGYGLTNLVNRATTRADEVTAEELTQGAAILRTKVKRFQPAWVAVLGLTSFRLAFARPRAKTGPQEENLASARLWVLPNPSGLNAHFTPRQLADLFQQLRYSVEKDD